MQPNRLPAIGALSDADTVGLDLGGPVHAQLPCPSTRRSWIAGLLLAAAVVVLPARVDAVWTTVEAGRGPVALDVPAGIDAQHPAPLAILLHGFGSSGLAEETYLDLAARFEAAGFLYATPDGTLDADGNRFWDATPACCDVYGTHPDDVAYLTALIDAIALQYNVDAKRVFFLGHENGGFMSYRMACELADRITAVASLAGASFADPAACAPARPVRVLEVHGTEDSVINYDGGTRLAPYPGARTTVETWAGYNNCTDWVIGEPMFDADASIPGVDTAVEVHRLECSGGGAELWSIVHGQTFPDLTDLVRDRLVAWLVAAGNEVMLDGFETGEMGAWTIEPLP